jgi:hypothetical protein
LQDRNRSSGTPCRRRIAVVEFGFDKFPQQYDWLTLGLLMREIGACQLRKSSSNSVSSRGIIMRVRCNAQHARRFLFQALDQTHR